MGVDRPSRSSEDDGQARRPERGQSGQKPPEGGEARSSRPERPQSQAERKRELDRRTAEAYRARHNSTTAAERQQEARARHEKAIAEGAKREARSPAEAKAEAKAFLEQRKARIEAYERGELPRSQLTGSERRSAIRREADRLIEAEKAKARADTTQEPDRGQGHARPDTTPTGQTEPEQTRARPDRPDGTANQAEQDQGRTRPDTTPTGQADHPRPADHGPDRPLTRREAELADAMTIGLGTQPDIDPERLAKARADLTAERAERAARGDTSPEQRPTEAPRDIDGVYRLLAQIHDPYPNADTPKPGDRPDATGQRDAPSEPRERAEHQDAPHGDTVAHGAYPHVPTAERTDEPIDRPPEATGIEAAKGELRAALDSGDDGRLRRAMEAMSSALDGNQPDTPNQQADQTQDRATVEWDRDENPYSPFGSPRTAHDTVIPEADREQFTKDAIDRTTEVLGRRPINAEYAGRVYYDKWPDSIKEQFPDGIPFSHEGFPEFAKKAIAVVRLDEGFGPTRQRDFARASKQWQEATGEKVDMVSNVWHHHEDGRTLLLVPRDLHENTRHSGGWAITGKLGTRRTDDA